MCGGNSELTVHTNGTQRPLVAFSLCIVAGGMWGVSP